MRTKKKPLSRLEHKTTTKKESKVTNQTIHSLCFISTYNYKYKKKKKANIFFLRGACRTPPISFPLSPRPRAPPHANPNPPTAASPRRPNSGHRVFPPPLRPLFSRCVPGHPATDVRAAPQLFPATASSPRRPAASPRRPAASPPRNRRPATAVSGHRCVLACLQSHSIKVPHLISHLFVSLNLIILEWDYWVQLWYYDCGLETFNYLRNGMAQFTIVWNGICTCTSMYDISGEGGNEMAKQPHVWYLISSPTIVQFRVYEMILETKHSHEPMGLQFTSKII